MCVRVLFINIKQDPEKSDWVLLEAPPFIKDKNTDENFEEQLVQVKFRYKDGLPNTQHKFVIIKKDNKYQMERVGAKREEADSDNQPTFNLTQINPRSISNTTHVSIKLEPKPITVAPRGSVAKEAIPIYDSSLIPDIDLRYVGTSYNSYCFQQTMPLCHSVIYIWQPQPCLSQFLSQGNLGVLTMYMMSLSSGVYRLALWLKELSSDNILR